VKAPTRLADDEEGERGAPAHSELEQYTVSQEEHLIDTKPSQSASRSASKAWVGVIRARLRAPRRGRGVGALKGG
jgi:hypothetical protein